MASFRAPRSAATGALLAPAQGTTFVLDIDVETLNRRLDGRPNEPGFAPDERALVLRYHETRQYLPAGIRIDTAGAVPSVVDDILARLA